MDFALRKKIQGCKLVYLPIPAESVPVIYWLFCHDQIGEPRNGIEHFYFGTYYYNLKYNRDQLIFHYTQAIEMGHIPSLHNLAFFYQDKEDGIMHRELIISYFQRAIDAGFEPSLCGLAGFYEDIGEDEKMKECYRQALARGYWKSYNYLGIYYEDKNWPIAKAYYLKAIEMGICYAAFNLSIYYATKKKSKRHFYYLKIAVQMGHEKSIDFLAAHYLTKPLKKKRLLFAVEHQQAELIKRHYQDKHVHYLLRASNPHLTPPMLVVKRQYVTALFIRLRQKKTWFSPIYCVKDITDLIQAYLL